MVGSSVPMNVLITVRLALPTWVCLLPGVASASAQSVSRTAGRALSVKGHRNGGDSSVRTLRSGGEVAGGKTLVERIGPGEVPHPDPVVAAAQQPKLQGPAPDRGAGLKISPYGELSVNTA